jgi:hypothetical protein
MMIDLAYIFQLIITESESVDKTFFVFSKPRTVVLYFGFADVSALLIPDSSVSHDRAYA